MDEPLSLDTVNQLATLIYQMPSAQAEAQSLRMREEQPLLHAYLGALRRRGLNEDEFGYIVTLGVTIWLVLEQAGRPSGEVTEEILQRTIESVDADFRGASADAPAEQRARAMRQITGHPEMGVLTYIIAALHQKADPPLSRSAQAVGFYHLRVVLDALIANRAPKSRPKRPRAARYPAGRA